MLFSVDGKEVTWSDGENNALAPGGTVVVTANGGTSGSKTWTALAGDHHITAFVDNIDRIPNESQEENNKLEMDLSIGATGGSSDSSSGTCATNGTCPSTGPTYYVNSDTGDDSNNGLSPSTAWKTMRKVNSVTFKPGEVVRFHGTFTDTAMNDPGVGTAAAPILFVGDGPFNGRARFRIMWLENTQHVTFRNIELTANYKESLISTHNSGAVRFLRFENMRLYNGNWGVNIWRKTDSDLTFVNTTIENTWMDGVFLDDDCGDRFSFIGGSIKGTGHRGYVEGWDVHAVYASGGHEHLFDGVEFGDNRNGSSLSLRRGNVTVRNCIFRGQAEDWSYMLSNFNEDEGSVNPATGHPSKNLTFWIYRNLFIGPGRFVQGDNNDSGTDDPNNTWVIYNNTFLNMELDFDNEGETRLSKYYNFYLRNNLFYNSEVRMGSAAAGKVRALSNNAWWNSGSPQGSSNITANPDLDASHNITAAAYRDSGTAGVAPNVTMKQGAAPSLGGFLGTAPDIGRSEQ